jgi:hypothetical protein
LTLDSPSDSALVGAFATDAIPIQLSKSDQIRIEGPDAGRARSDRVGL